ncbi:MAG: hypothetical protein ACFFCX_15400, partial [Candidatus Sifarchaeia archaeon]
KHLNKCLSELSFIIAVIIWIFGIRTYFLSWLIDFTLERQLLVFSSVFASIWAISLFMDQSNRIRILTDIMLLGGLAVGLFVWSTLANLTLFLLGSIAFCSVLIHLILIFVHYFDKSTMTYLDPITSPTLSDVE